MLINDTDFWKLNIKNGKVVAVFVYTFKRGGRKLVYCGSDGTQVGKDALKKIIDDDIKFIERQSWVEVSGALAHIHLKKGANILDVEIAQKLLPDKKIIPLGRKVYQREIGGVMVNKIIIGNIK
jgi:3D (Asp-Asp-Asp) domain-containing protein